MAAKRTAEMIPLCHPLQLTHVDVDITPRRDGFEIEARVRTNGPTGVEMEALTAVSVAALTLYDMIKAVDKAMEIGGIHLIEKRGGRSGEFKADPSLPSRRRTVEHSRRHLQPGECLEHSRGSRRSGCAVSFRITRSSPPGLTMRCRV